MGSSISDFWIYTTAIIENEQKDRGTGFFIAKPAIEGSNECKVYLITNKHVLATDSANL